MATSSSTWKRAERQGALIFGARRQPLSGSSGRDDLTRSDSNHPALFLEAKLRQVHAARTLHDATKALARKEGKTPVLILRDKGRPGALLVVHEDDAEAFVVWWAAARVLEGEPGDRLEGLIRRAVARLRGEAPEIDGDADLDGDPPAAC